MSHLNVFSYNKVNKILEDGTFQVAKLPDRKGYERRVVTFNKKPMRISSPQFNYKCFQMDKYQEEAIRMKNIMSTILSNDENQGEVRKDKFDVIFDVHRSEVNYCEFVKEMEVLSQSIKEKFDKNFDCQTQNEILETIEDQSSLYPHTYEMHPRKIKFSSLFHAIEEDSNFTVAHFLRDGKRVQIDADMKSFYKETKGELVQVRFVFVPIIYSKDSKYYLKNEVIYILFNNFKKKKEDFESFASSDEED